MDPSDNEIYSGLQTLAKTAFPKRCRDCGRLYHTVGAFIKETRLRNLKHSGLNERIKEDGSKTVELFRDCPCGSTLMDVFNNRRDVSEEGIKRRNHFDALIKTVETKYSIDPSIARAEILKIMDGKSSEVIDNIMPPPKPNEQQP